LLEREDSPWYPTLRLFRQTSRGDWKEVLERMTEEVREVGVGAAEEEPVPVGTHFTTRIPE
jgi:hypothetical protein